MRRDHGESFSGPCSGAPLARVPMTSPVPWSPAQPLFSAPLSRDGVLEQEGRWQYSQKKTGHLSMAGDSFTCLSLCLPALTLSAAAAAAIGSGLGLVDLDLARAELFSVQRADGLTASIIVSDFDEPKSARPTGFTISDEIHFAHFAELAKQFANLILS